MSADKITERINAALAKMEPEVAGVSREQSLSSIAISLKRIADSLDELKKFGENHNFGFLAENLGGYFGDGLVSAVRRNGGLSG